MNDIQKILLSDFQLDEDKNVYFHEKNQNFDYSDGFKTENYILKSIKESKDISDNSIELLKWINDWPSYYHLGMGRSNIIGAFELSNEAKVLELGCGCGAITRYLGENFKSIDAVDGSPLRTEITRERCRDLENVNVYCSNFNSLKFDSTYDVVTAIGVLEYAPIYYNDKVSPKEACLFFLKHLNSALNDSGFLMLGIENKIGIKYWNGLPEDHTGTIYDSIQDYPNSTSPITFSKKELGNLLREAGFHNISFFSCFPDYKFADTIISDKGSEKDYYLHNWIGVPFKCYNCFRQNYNFHDGLIIKTLSEAGLIREFANSFLILASKEGSQHLNSFDWVVKKFSNKRRDAFKCVTTLNVNSDVFVEKKRVNGDAEDYIFENNGIKIKHSVGTSDWIKGDALIFDVYKAFYQKNWKKSLLDVLELYYKELLSYKSGTIDEEGYPLIKGTDMDFTINNLIKSHEDLILIDNEWPVEDIPADYLLYRCIRGDIVHLNINLLRKKVVNTDKFVFELIKHFFPNYTSERHKKNKTLEDNFQKLVSIEQPLVIPNTVFKSLIAKIWKILPETIKEYIVTLLIKK